MLDYPNYFVEPRRHTMTTTNVSEHSSGLQPGTGWQIIPASSAVEFSVRHFWSMITVTGKFDRFDGSLTTAPDGIEQIELTIDAASIDTGQSRRDKHLRDADFFAVDEHPQVKFTSTHAVKDDNGQILHITGDLEAAGKRVPLSFDATVREFDDELEFEATTTVDQRLLGMTWSPLGVLRVPATLHVKVRLGRV